MSSDVMEQLKQLSNAERLQVMEAATRLIRKDLAEPALSARDALTTTRAVCAS